MLIDTCQSTSNPHDQQGLNILSALKARFSELATVLVTAQAVDFETTREAFKAGAYDYLWKPQDTTILRQIVETLVKQEETHRLIAYQQSLLRQAKAYEVHHEGEAVEVRYRL